MPLTSVQLWVDKILEPVPTDLESAAHVSYYQQGGRGHWAVHNTSPQSFITTFSYSLANNLGYFYFLFDSANNRIKIIILIQVLLA